MSSSCICRILRKGLLIEVSHLACRERFNALVVKSSSIAKPLPSAETFTFEDSHSQHPSDIARLDTLITVADGTRFLKQYRYALSLQKTGKGLDANSECNIADLLINQIKFYDIRLISKSDLVNTKQMNKLKAALRLLPRQKFSHQHRQHPDRQGVSRLGASTSSVQSVRTAG